MNLTIPQALQLAEQHFARGSLREAEAVFRQILTADANNAGALHGLGVIASQSGQETQAIALLQRAAALDPLNSRLHTNMGVTYERFGQFDKAIQCHRQALALDPNLADGYYNLGVALIGQGDLPAAEQAYRAAAQLNPANPAPYKNLGALFDRLGRHQDAAAAFLEASRRAPQESEILINLGMMLEKTRSLPDAITRFNQALALSPNNPLAYCGLGHCHLQAQHGTQAFDAFKKALALDPNLPDAWCGLCNVLQRSGRLSDALSYALQAVAKCPDSTAVQIKLGAIYFALADFSASAQCMAQAAKIDPSLASAHSNLGLTLHHQGKFQEALQAYATGLEKDPQNIDIRANRSLTHLLLGDFQRGWEDYECRWLCSASNITRRNFAQPHWDGSSPIGKAILVYTEQGFGDVIHFVRYLPLMAQRGATVILESVPELFGLLKSVPGISQVIHKGDPLPPFDLQCPIVSLPRLFGTNLTNIPASIPYLTVPQAALNKWREKLGPRNHTRRIGLAWAGSSTHINDGARSCPPVALSPLAKLPNVTWYSLQKSPAPHPGDLPPSLSLIDFTADLHDFTDTAALISQLDLLISVDTSVVHVAGALGKPVWTLLPHIPDFRWLLDRADTPWYPTMRLFRQKQNKAWAQVIAAVVAELQSLVPS